MYVAYAEYAETAFASAENAVSEEDYPRLAALADAVVDAWTYGRVGDAVGHGEELPYSVRALYAAVVNNGRSLVEESSSGSGDVVSSFSNGVDSYSFDVDSDTVKRLESSLGWMIDALPLRFTSACVYPVGRCFGRCYGAC